MKLMNNKTIKYDKNNIQNVLINSNFSCGFFINRSELAKILKMKYNLQPIYDAVLILEYNVNFTIIVKMIFMMANVVVVTNVISKRKKKKSLYRSVFYDF